jgi:hypothetical protein
MIKHSSLFIWSISGKEKMLLLMIDTCSGQPLSRILPPGIQSSVANVMKTFSSSEIRRPKTKQEHLTLAKLSNLVLY